MGAFSLIVVTNLLNRKHAVTTSVMTGRLLK